ncbi:hypothetical protein BJX63DRAFT_422095 [Aspergillus granulosus]|uniref:Fungal N-terminal domain-containing protein n=1 Tax=Aspergillus granulosus TaxID=176169 RepID=A0ABR4H8X7_9EURO
MSFGWSVGDLFQGAAIVWAIYESFGNRERSAKVEFAAFQTEFGLIKSALERLRDVAANCPGEDLSLGNEYAQTLERCASFIKRHQTLALENGTSSVKGKARRPSLQERVSSAWDKVSWPFEREEAERLRSQLERYVQIAIFKVTASTSDRTRKMAVDNLEILKAVKAMSVQVSTILRRCLPDGTPDDTALDSRYLARLQQRNLPTLLDPLPGLNSIPEDGVLSESDSQAALHRIKEITDRLGHLASRLDTIGRQPTPSPERRPLKRIQTSDSIGSDTTVGAPVVDLLNRIGDEVRDALNKVGYEYPVVPGQHKVSPHGSGPSSKALNDAAEDWEQFREWLQFQVVHSPEVQTGHDVPLLEPWQRHSPSPEPKYPPMTLFDPSPPNHSYLRACSPSRLPLSNDRGVEMSRTSSIDSNYPGSPLSIDSGWDRRSSIQSLPLTQHPVQVLFLDRKGAKHLHPPLRCQVVAHIKQRTNEPEVIEGTDTKNGFKITHCLYREHPSDREETSMIPYVSHSRHGQTFSKTPFCIRFMGSHRIQLERPGKEKKKWAISPIYVCQDKEDFDMFQNTLLGRRVIFRGDVTRIHSNTGDYCSLDTVRVIQDRLTNTTSILYFSTRKDSPRALSHFVDLPVSSLSTPKITGKNAVKIPLLAAQRDGFGLIPRRNSVESTMTSISQKSGNSIFSVASTAVSESEWKKEKWLQFDFENSQGAPVENCF